MTFLANLSGLAWGLQHYTQSSCLRLVWACHEARIRKLNRDGRTMNTHVIQDWTSTQVPMKYGDGRNVRYKVFQNGKRLYQEIRDIDDNLIHILELPQGMAMEKSSYEVLLRYVLVDVVNA